MCKTAKYFPTYLPVYPIHKRTVCVCVCLCMRVVLCVGPWVWTPLNKETILFGVLLDLLRVPYTKIARSLHNDNVNSTLITYFRYS